MTRSGTEDIYRIERDSMGEMRVPRSAYYGAQTQRAVENFPISRLRFPRPMINALGIIKCAAAKVNHELGLLDNNYSNAILSATSEVEGGMLDKHFVLDIFQTGSGTSTNMNANEVIAKRGTEILRESSKDAAPLHPNDHVNMSQSSNDVIPTAIHIAAAIEIKKTLLPALGELHLSLARKEKEFDSLVKTGRTHLQDATPIRLGQEFSGYASQISQGMERIERSLTSLYELPLGGTAVGTGINTHPEFAKKAISLISKKTGLPFIEARNHFEAQSAKDALVEMSGQLRTVACSLAKIANDIRWLASGPRCGLGEITLPSVQPGSSIMPGKINPVICESVLMVTAQVMGNDTAIAISGHSGGNFELNVMMPVMAHNLLEMIEILSTSSRNFAAKCIDGIQANTERLHQLAEANISVVTALAPKIGYDTATSIAKEAFTTGESLREVARKRKVLSDSELDEILNLMRMTKPGL
jgi:fumarate hydratase, class II